MSGPDHDEAELLVEWLRGAAYQRGKLMEMRARSLTR
jgi:hypothetical protein